MKVVKSGTMNSNLQTVELMFSTLRHQGRITLANGVQGDEYLLLMARVLDMLGISFVVLMDEPLRQIVLLKG